MLLTAGGQAFREQGDPGRPAPDLQALRADRPRRRADHREAQGAPQNIKRVIHNFRLLTEELGKKDTQLAEFVDSSNANFKALRRTRSENIQAALRELPADAAAGRDDADERRPRSPTSSARRPRRCGRSHAALGPTLVEVRPFLRETTPIIRDQLRPFAREARPAVRELREAADKLEPLTPRLTRTFTSQLAGQHACLQPARRRGGLPVLGLVGQPRGRVDLRHPGRARPDPPRLGHRLVQLAPAARERRRPPTRRSQLLFQLLGAPDRRAGLPEPARPASPETTPKEKAERRSRRPTTQNGGADAGKPVAPAQPEGKPTTGKPAPRAVAGGEGK